MAIHINLLAEARIAEEMRRRDPVKRTIYVGAFLVVLALVWTSYLLLDNVIAKTHLSQVEGATQSRTNEYNRVMASRAKIADAQKRLEALQRLSQARLLQGDLMNALQKISVPNVQLTQLRVDQAYLSTGGSPSKTTQYGVIAGQPPKSMERVVLTLEAKDFSANPGDAVNKYKDAVSQYEYFEGMLDKTNGIRLASLSAPQTGPDGRPYVLFTLECRYLDHTR